MTVMDLARQALPEPVKRRLRVLMGLPTQASSIVEDKAACIDSAVLSTNGCLAVTGWALPSLAEFSIVTDQGDRVILADAHVIKRPDVAERFADKLGASGEHIGFLAYFRSADQPRRVRMVVGGGKRDRVICERPIDTADADPVAYARRLFSAETPAYGLAERIAKIDLPAINAVVETRNRLNAHNKIDRWDFGEAPKQPNASVIVPLYRRWDFVEHQLLSFSSDPEFRGANELIFVVDDNSILADLLSAAGELFEIYDVPFSIIWGHANRGYSGANNLGARASKGNFLVFLNSDAFPKTPGCVGTLTQVLKENATFGIIAPRLLFADGGLQHVGIEFRWNNTFRVWVNDHPLLGLPPAADQTEDLVERQAVTGACMVARRKEFEELGGFDQGYLIGDFEDSDLCLKYRSKGLLPGYYPGVELVHLERQSLMHSGTPAFRQKVVIYNAVRHYQRWGSIIDYLVESGGSEARQ